MSTIAVVFQPSTPQISISEEKLSTILRRPISIGQTPDGQSLISSNRDQIEVQLSVNRLNVRELSGIPNQGRDKIPGIVSEFSTIICIPTETALTYGVNFILEIPKEEPDRWLGDNLLNPALRGKIDVPVSTRLVSIAFSKPPKNWTVKFESRENSKINVDLNASERTEMLPNADRLREEMEQQFEALLEFLTLLGL